MYKCEPSGVNVEYGRTHRRAHANQGGYWSEIGLLIEFISTIAMLSVSNACAGGCRIRQMSGCVPSVHLESLHAQMIPSCRYRAIGSFVVRRPRHIRPDLDSDRCPSHGRQCCTAPRPPSHRATLPHRPSLYNMHICSRWPEPALPIAPRCAAMPKAPPR